MSTTFISRARRPVLRAALQQLDGLLAEAGPLPAGTILGWVLHFLILSKVPGPWLTGLLRHVEVSQRTLMWLETLQCVQDAHTISHREAPKDTPVWP